MDCQLDQECISIKCEESYQGPYGGIVSSIRLFYFGNCSFFIWIVVIFAFFLFISGNLFKFNSFLLGCLLKYL